MIVRSKVSVVLGEIVVLLIFVAPFLAFHMQYQDGA